MGIIIIRRNFIQCTLISRFYTQITLIAQIALRQITFAWFEAFQF